MPGGRAAGPALGRCAILPGSPAPATARRCASPRPARFLAALAILLAAASPAAAHVDVLPTTVTKGTATQFTVRVPTERSIPTVGVTITFPPQITVFAFQPVPGWTRVVKKAPDGTTTGVAYTGGRILPGEYMDFPMLGSAFGEVGTTVWKARQLYADGKVKPWTGPPEKPGAVSEESGPTDPGPAAAVQIVAPGTSTTAGAASSSSDDGSSGAGIWLGIIAIVFAAGALLATGFLWASRPMTLPEDPAPADAAPAKEPRPQPKKRGRG